MRVMPILIALCCVAAAQAVLIQEAYPDPEGTDNGGEAVLLWNDGEAIDISRWKLDTPSATPDATIPDGTILSPGQAYLIADSGWSDSKDDPDWANANTEQGITLRNDGGKLTLRDANGTVIDEIIYPASGTGMAYWRQGDEMMETEPLFSEPLDAMMLLGISGSGSSSSLSITDNGNEATQVNLVAGDTKYLSIVVEYETTPEITLDGEQLDVEQLSSGRYGADAPLPFTTTPGEHTVTAGELSRTFEVLPLLAVQSDVDSLELDGNSVEGDDEWGNSRPTLRNAGNVDVEIRVSRTSVLLNGSRTMATVEINAGSASANVTSTSVLLTYLSPGDSVPLGARIITDKPGDYSTSLAFQLREN